MKWNSIPFEERLERVLERGTAEVQHIFGQLVDILLNMYCLYDVVLLIYIVLQMCTYVMINERCKNIFIIIINPFIFSILTGSIKWGNN